MKFPGRRKTKHYFPVGSHGRIPLDQTLEKNNESYITGIEQLLIDIEVNVSDEFLKEFGISKGQSMVLDDRMVASILTRLEEEQIVAEFAGGTIGNTLHNYSVLTDDRSVLLGTISETMRVGDYAFNYVCNTSSHVSLSYLQPVDGDLAKAICFVTPDKERTFCISKGIMNELDPSYVNEEVIKGSSALLITAYLLRDENAPIFHSTMKAVSIAREYNVPVVLTMGTSSLIQEKHDFLVEFIKNYVNVAAMNDEEAKALSGTDDPLLAGTKILEMTDLVLLTVGSQGLYMCGYVDREAARETKDQIHSKSIAEYNKFEYSRSMKRQDCKDPVKIYTHINPYMGGPGAITNTNGAGDAALAAVLHDIAANAFHRKLQPSSPKHSAPFLTYSSIHQISKYANRVSFEVLSQNSPRLSRGLPDREENLKDAYWDL
ncbi:inosine/guanosine kinase [Spirochaeta isovalerica]|uniref:Inosine kinase n=1 Tax=Spirochaeta isovalerica TaxID=150 RepID=A0A841R7D6_9SPIO|nr:inosine/guanosine kinase [Spirochaeta isovalerica]MBB6478412.1 inosine kinase [Spirochaeta isovalerica]